jgi:CubicO group peptidase (beta-lactamase class C family)
LTVKPRETQTKEPPLKIVRSLAVLPLLFGPPASALGQESALSGRVRSAMQRFVDEGEIAGAVAVVGDAGGVLAVEAVGLREVEGASPMRPDALFRIASMTKPITGIAVMILVEQGIIRLDDPVAKHLPSFDGQMMLGYRQGDSFIARRPGRPITIRDLLTHTSGLPDGPLPDSPEREARPPTTLAQSAENYGRRRLSFEPGSKWSYSNAGINTLGRVIEVASGMSYEDFLKARIFDPLGMVDTTFYPTPDRMKRLAMTYSKDGEGLRPIASAKVAPKAGERPPSPAGGLYSTGPDYARVCRMTLGRGSFEGRRILSESSLAEMTRLQTGDLPCGFVDGMGFGLAWAFVKAPTGVTEALSPGSFGHGGAFGTQAWVDPKKGRFAVLLIQRVGLANNDATPMRRELQRVAFGD